MHDPTIQPPTPEFLDALAKVVAAALDDGEEDRAWALTRALEEIADSDEDTERPPSPVIGRRFARAHRRLLARTDIAGRPRSQRSGRRRRRAVVAQAVGARAPSLEAQGDALLGQRRTAGRVAGHGRGAVRFRESPRS